MGIPTLFRWLSSKYPRISVPVIEESEQEIDGVKIPIDFSKPNPNRIEFDNLYLDMNGIIHPCCHPEDKSTPPTEDDMMLKIFEYIDRIMGMVRPRKILYMAVDGVAPRAKMNQQRSRRFRAIQEAEEALEKKAQALEEDLSATISIMQGGNRENETEKFDRNCITPGTPFMANLVVALRYYVTKKLNTDPAWRPLKVFLSDSSVPGEGEHKIMDFIRRQRCESGYNANTKHVMYGLDADLIMLGLATHEPNFYILREVVYPPNPNFNLCSQCLLPGHRSFQCGNEFKAEIDPITGRKPFLFLEVLILREYLEAELYFLERNTGFPFDLERAIDDWVFLCFFVGNDFLPHAPCLEIREGAIDLLTDIYKKNLTKMGGYITDSGKVNLQRAHIIAKELGEKETRVFFLRKEEAEKRVQALKRKKNLDFCRQQKMSRSQIDAHMLKFDRKMEARLTSSYFKAQGNDLVSINEKLLLSKEDKIESPVSNHEIVKYRNRVLDPAAIAQPILRKKIKSISVSALRSPDSALEGEKAPMNFDKCDGEKKDFTPERENKELPSEHENVPQNTGMKVEKVITTVGVDDFETRVSESVGKGSKLDSPITTTLHPPSLNDAADLLNSEPVASIPDTIQEEFLDYDFTAAELQGENPPPPSEEYFRGEGYPHYEEISEEPEADVTMDAYISVNTEDPNNYQESTQKMEIDGSLKRKRTEIVEPSVTTNVMLDSSKQSIATEEELFMPSKKRVFDVTAMSSNELYAVTKEEEAKFSENFYAEERKKESEALEHQNLEDANQLLNEEEEEDAEDDEEEAEVDILQLAEEGGADRYYLQKFRDNSISFRKKVAQAYLEGMCWVLHYYYLGCPSWNWFYPFHYAPLAVDFDKVDISETAFDLGKPFRPFDQLMAVLPPASRQHIPCVFHSLMTSPDSEIIDFYPETFDVDLNGKKHAWQGVVLLPFIDEERLLNALATKYPLLTQAERELNTHGHDLLMVSALHMLYPTICTLYDTSYLESAGNPQEAQPTDAQGEPKVLPNFRLKLSVHNDEVSGFLGYDELSCPPGATFVSPFSDHLEVARDILHNKSISAAYHIPFHPTSKFKSQLLPTLKMPSRKLSWVEVIQASNFHRRRHPHILVESYGTQVDLIKPPGIPHYPEQAYSGDSRSRPSRRSAYSYPVHGPSQHHYYSHSTSTVSRSHTAISPSLASASHQYSSHYSLRHFSAPGSFSSSVHPGRSSVRGTHLARGMSSSGRGYLPSASGSHAAAAPGRSTSHSWRSPAYHSPLPSAHHYHLPQQLPYHRGNMTYHRGVSRGGSGSSNYRTDAYSGSLSSRSANLSMPVSRAHYSGSQNYYSSTSSERSGGSSARSSGNPMHGGPTSSYSQGHSRGGPSTNLAWSRNLKRGSRGGRPPVSDY